MTDKRQSDALHLAGIADDGAWTFVIEVRKEIAAELRRQYAEIETLRTGYEAARLEIESLKAQQPGAAIQRYKIGYHADEWGQRSSTPSGIPDASGSWVRYADHVTALAAGQATTAQAAPADLAGPSKAITASIMRDDGGDHPAFCLMVAYRSQADADAALELLAAAPTTQPAHQQEAQEPYSIDADPQGIRAIVADAITGVLAFGAQGTNAPPDGHWLAPFWATARAEREEAPQPSPAAQGDALDAKDKAARFQAQHEFMLWNRKQTPPPIESPTEYSIFNQAIDFYIAALKGK